MSYSGGHNFDPYAAVDVDSARDEEGNEDPMAVSFHQDYPEHPFGDTGSKAIPQSDSSEFPLGQHSAAGFDQQQHSQPQQQQSYPFDQNEQIDQNDQLHQSSQHQQQPQNQQEMELEPAFGHSVPHDGIEVRNQNQNQKLFGGAPAPAPDSDPSAYAGSPLRPVSRAPTREWRARHPTGR